MCVDSRCHTILFTFMVNRCIKKITTNLSDIHMFYPVQYIFEPDDVTGILRVEVISNIIVPV